MKSKSTVTVLLVLMVLTLNATPIRAKAWWQPKHWFPKHIVVSRVSHVVQKAVESKVGKVAIGAEIGIAGAAITASTGGIIGSMMYSNLAAGALAGGFGFQKIAMPLKVSNHCVPAVYQMEQP